MARRLQGTVISNRMDKTVVVVVTSLKQHPLYHKKYHVSRKFLAHDPDNSYHPGDRVEISEARPLSKRKRWLVEKVLAKTTGETS